MGRRRVKKKKRKRIARACDESVTHWWCEWVGSDKIITSCSVTLSTEDLRGMVDSLGQGCVSVTTPRTSFALGLLTYFWDLLMAW